MTMVLSPSPLQRFFDDRGVPLAGGQLFTYAAGTNTKLTSYQNAAGAVNTNPIVLNARGECDLWIPPNIAYDYVLAYANDTDPPSNPIWTKQSIVASQLTTLYGGVDIGAANAYVLSFVSNFSAYGDGIVVYWLPSHTNTGPSTVNINGLGVVNIKNADGTALNAGAIVANTMVAMIYLTSATGFVLLNPASFTSGSFSATVLGCTTAPTKTVTWARAGQLITLNIPATGVLVSNSTSFGMSGLPTNLQLAVAAPTQQVYGILAEDNGVLTYGAGDAFISASSNVITFEFKGGVWTNSGNKLFSGFTFTYFNSSNFG